MLPTKTAKLFSRTFGYQPSLCTFAPGKINLLGNQVEGGNGWVCSIATSLGAVVAGTKTEGNKCRVIIMGSDNFEEFEASRFMSCCIHNKWLNCIMGIVYEFLSRHEETFGFDMAVATDIPESVDMGWLSSVEMAVSLFLEEVLVIHLTAEERAHLCQKAEEEFVGLKGSLIDKLVISGARNSSVLFYKEDSSTGISVPFDGTKFSVIICNPGVRIQQVPCCKEVMTVLKEQFPQMKTLDDVHISQLKTLRGKLDPDVYKVVAFCVKENEIALRGKEGLLAESYEKFGGAMLYSHTNYRDILNINCREIDTLITMTDSYEDVFGIKMNEKGTVLILVERKSEESVMKRMMKLFKKKFGRDCEMTICHLSGGVRILPKEDWNVDPYSQWKTPLLWASIGMVVGAGLMMFIHSHQH